MRKSELLKLKGALDERSAKLLQEQVSNDLDGPLLEMLCGTAPDGTVRSMLGHHLLPITV